MKNGKRKLRSLVTSLGFICLPAGADGKGRLENLPPTKIAEFTPTTPGPDSMKKLGTALAEMKVRLFAGAQICAVTLCDIISGDIRRLKYDEYVPHNMAGVTVKVPLNINEEGWSKNTTTSVFTFRKNNSCGWRCCP